MNDTQADALIAYAEAVQDLISVIPDSALTPEIVAAQREVKRALHVLRLSFSHLTVVA